MNDGPYHRDASITPGNAHAVDLSRIGTDRLIEEIGTRSEAMAICIIPKNRTPPLMLRMSGHAAAALGLAELMRQRALRITEKLDR